ncbi:hypothetical protein NKH18_48500 [Streptomyces sp. M10(2022)]
MDKKQQWHGAADLWVRIPTLGSTARSAEGYRAKYVSVTLDEQGKVTDRKGPPTVSAERVDGSGTARGSTGGYASAEKDNGRRIRWWPTTIDFPDGGCWLVTEVLGSTTVRVLLRVPTP